MTPGGQGRSPSGAGGPDALYGIHAVAEALRAARRRLHEVHLSDRQSGDRLDWMVALAADRGVPVRRSDPEALARRCGSRHHQGVVLTAGPYPYLDGDDLSEALSTSGEAAPFFVFLDSVQDPHNLGAVIRTALCAGVHGIVVPRKRTAPATPAVSRVSAGALEHARLYRVTNLADTLKRLRERTRLWVVGLDGGAEKSLFDAELRGPLGLVVGGEDQGIRHLVAARCDDRVSIPQEGPVTSLNASVAAAVGIYEAVRQRGQVPPART